MMIKPSEISSILQMQLQQLNNRAQFEEFGKVLHLQRKLPHVGVGMLARKLQDSVVTCHFSNGIATESR